MLDLELFAFLFVPVMATLLFVAVDLDKQRREAKTEEESEPWEY